MGIEFNHTRNTQWGNLKRLNDNNTSYNGLWQQPHSEQRHTSIAFTSDRDCKELYIFLLNPGGFNGAYKIAKHISCKNIFIFTPSMDLFFLSDFVRLFYHLNQLKSICKCVFPSKLGIYNFGAAFENNFINSKSFIYNFSNENIFVKYLTTPIKDIYNIQVDDGNRNIIFSTFMNDELFEKYNNDVRVKEIHLPYNHTLFGGRSFLDIIGNYKDNTKIRANSFSNTDEFDDCIKNYGKEKIVEVLPYEHI